jgi:hypothetical protein
MMMKTLFSIPKPSTKKQIWLLAGFLFGFSLHISCWAIETPQELVGKWHANGSEYYIEVQGPRVILHKPYKSGTRNPFVGMFNPKGFDIRFRPQQEYQLNPDLPQPIRQQVILRGHQFQGHLDFSTPGKVIFTEQVDHIFYDEAQMMLTGIEVNQGTTTVELVKDAGFKIGPITVDDSRLSQRIQGEGERLEQEIKRLREQAIPAAEQDAQQAEQALLTLAEEIESLTRQSDQLQQEGVRIQQEIQAAVTQHNPEYDSLTQRREQLNREMRALESVIADYRSKNNENGVRSLQRQLQSKQLALKSVNHQVAAQFGRRDAVGGLEQQLSQLQTRKNDMMTRLGELKSRIPNLRSSFEGQLQDLQALQTSLNGRENQLAYMRRKPIIDRIEFTVKGQQYFLAEAQQNPELWKQFEENMATIDQDIVQLREKKQEVEREKEPLLQAMSEARANFDQAKIAIRQAGDEIYNSLLKSMAARSVTETAAYAADLGLAFKDGGPAGLLVELGGKAVESLQLGVTGETAFTLFDETALREKMFGQTPTRPFSESHAASDGDEHVSLPAQRRAAPVERASALSRFGQERFDEIPLEATKAIINQTKNAYERRLLERQAADAAKFLTEHPFNTGLRDAPEQALNNLAKAQQELGEAYTAAQALRRQTGASFSELGELGQVGREYRRSLLRQRVAMDNLSQALTEQLGTLDTIRRNRTAFQEANKKITAMGGLRTKVGGILKSVGKGFAVDGMKAFLNNWIDQEEQDAWIAFFEKEIYLQATRAAMQAASNEYYGLEDKLKLVDESIIALQQYRQQTESDRQNYLTSKQREGFHIVNNLEFEPQDPIEMRVTTVGYSHGEQVTLTKQGDPRGQNVVEGQRVRPSQLNAPASGPVTFASLDRQIHTYIFPASRMGTTQARGPLPLQINLQ